MIFYLGTHRPAWLTRTDIPLFVSRRTLADYKVWPKAIGTWAMDSGGFSELQLYGKWTVSTAEYAGLVRRAVEETGRLEWAAPQDWMCEPFMLAKTGLTVKDHQRLTTANYLALRHIAPELPIIPVLQGWEPDDYLFHAEDYATAGVDLVSMPLVGVGSVCRRQGTEDAMQVLRPLYAMGLRLHGFGFKVDGLWQGASYLLASADSLAWSRRARWEKPLPGCSHKSCANCMTYAMRWRQRVVNASERGEQNYQMVLM